MEKKLPEDNLERFLRSSFEDFKQVPSDDLWNKIDSSLATKPVFYKRTKPWMYWTAAACMLSFVIIAQFKSNQILNKKLEMALLQNQELNEKSENKPDSSPQPAGELNLQSDQSLSKTEDATKSDQEGVTVPSIKDREIAVNKTTPEIVDDKQKDLSTAKAISTKKELAEAKAKTAMPDISPTNQKKPVSPEKNENEPVRLNSKTNKLNSKNKSNQAIIPSQKENQIIIENQKLLAHGTNKSETRNSGKTDLSKPIDLSSDPMSNESTTQLDQKEIAAQRTKDAVTNLTRSILPVLASSDIEKLNYPGGTLNLIDLSKNTNRSTGLELSVSAGALIEKGEITSNRLFDPRINDFPKNEYTSSNSWMTGIELNKYLTQNWSISSGIGFKHFEFINGLTQSLSFKNREQPKPGNLPFQHDFKCKLPGPTGTSDITINSEQLDSRASISDAEEVKIAIKNNRIRLVKVDSRFIGFVFP